MNNAGIAIAAPLEFLPPEELARQLDVNVVGQLRVVQAFLPGLRRSRGRIVFVGSIAGKSALPFLGAYQAVSHSIVDSYIAVELARSLAYWAAWCVAEGDEQAAVAVAAAKSFCGDTAVTACERSLQVHGGIGFTWEHVLHRYYKRALWIQAYGGYAREHRAQIAAWLLDDRA